MIRNSRNYISDHLATKQNKSHEMLASVTPHVTQSQNVPYNDSFYQTFISEKQQKPVCKRMLRVSFLSFALAWQLSGLTTIWAHNYLSITMENMLTMLMVTKISLLLVNNWKSIFVSGNNVILEFWFLSTENRNQVMCLKQWVSILVLCLLLLLL